MVDLLDTYQLLKDLGNGAFSKVCLARDTETDDYVAIKIVKNFEKSSDSMKETFINEILIMQGLDHPHIVKLLDFSESGTLTKPSGEQVEGIFYIVLQLAPGGCLFDFILETGYFSEKVARYYFHQIIDAFEYLHSQGISHRDMKPDNILLDGNFNLIIADFGLSSNAATNVSTKGTIGFMAPEIIMGMKYRGHAVDIYASGVILFIMLTQMVPFHSSHPQEQTYKYICQNRMDKFWMMHSKHKTEGMDFYSEDFIELIEWLFNFDQFVRPSLSEIKEHRWFKGPVATQEEILEEFDKRRNFIDSYSLDNQMELPATDVSEEELADHCKYRSIIGDEEDSKALTTLSRTEELYIPQLNVFTKFFSSSPVTELFHWAISFAMTVASTFELSPTSYQVKFNCVSKEKAKIEIKVSVLKVNDTKHWVEIIKYSGDKFYFHTMYKQLKSYFGGHVNSTG